MCQSLHRAFYKLRCLMRQGLSSRSVDEAVEVQTGNPHVQGHTTTGGQSRIQTTPVPCTLGKLTPVYPTSGYRTVVSKADRATLIIPKEGKLLFSAPTQPPFSHSET